MIYIHVPFCKSFCVYCDFYSETSCVHIGSYADCLLDEISRRRGEIESTSAVNTLYFGGGTPSVLPLDVFSRIVSALPVPPRGEYDEFTVEVNPEDIVRKGEDYVRGLMELGVNRVSMGVQSLSDELLRWMRRRHDASGARKAFEILRSSGVKNISVDVIFGISSLSESVLSQTLEEIISWNPEHVSAYQLSIEEGSDLAGMVSSGQYEEASEDQCRSQYDLICKMLSSAGYRHYEISNWARPGFEAVHNSAYWHRAPYVGLGPGAHSLLASSPEDPSVPASSPKVSSVPVSSPEDSFPEEPSVPVSSPKVSSAEVSSVPVSSPEDSFPEEPSVPVSSAKDSSVPNVRSWNSQVLCGWTSESETLTPEEIREEQIMLGLRTAEGIILPDGRPYSIPESDWFISDAIISDLI